MLPQSLAVAAAGLKMPAQQALHTIAALKCGGVEIDARNQFKPSEISSSGIRQLRKILNDRNLTVRSVRFATRRGYDTLEDLDRRVQATKDAMRLATELGCRTLVNSIGRIDSADEERMQVLRDVLHDLARHSDHHGCFLAAETGSESLTDLAGFLRSLPEQTIFVALNPAALIGHGFSLDDLPTAAELVRCVYAIDAVPDRSRIDNIAYVPLGQGIVELPNVISVLADQAFVGPYVVDPGYSSNPQASAQQALEFLRAL